MSKGLDVIHKIKEEYLMVHHSTSSSFVVRLLVRDTGTRSLHFSFCLIQGIEISLALRLFKKRFFSSLSVLPVFLQMEHMIIF